MSDFSKFKIGSTSYDVKDAAAAKTIAISGGTVSLKNAAGTVISSITLPQSNAVELYYVLFTTTAGLASWNNTTLQSGALLNADGTPGDWDAITSNAVFYVIVYAANDLYVATMQRHTQDAAQNIIILTAEIAYHNTSLAPAPDGTGYIYSEYNLALQDWTGKIGKYVAAGGGGGSASIKKLIVCDQWEIPMSTSSFISNTGTTVLMDENGNRVVPGGFYTFINDEPLMLLCADSGKQSTYLASYRSQDNYIVVCVPKNYNTITHMVISPLDNNSWTRIYAN